MKSWRRSSSVGATTEASNDVSVVSVTDEGVFARWTFTRDVDAPDIVDGLRIGGSSPIAILGTSGPSMDLQYTFGDPGGRPWTCTAADCNIDFNPAGSLIDGAGTVL